MTAKHVDVVILPSSFAFRNSVCVFGYKEVNILTLLLSSFFEAWLLEYCGTVGAGRLAINIKSGVRTFPIPNKINEESYGISRKLYNAMETLMQESGGGLTFVFNRFHDPNYCGSEIGSLRDLRGQLDSKVAELYGLQDLELEHDFFETKQGIRYTISESARRTVLDRLLALNHQRYEEEVKAGLHDKKAKKATSSKRGRKAKIDQTEELDL